MTISTPSDRSAACLGLEELQAFQSGRLPPPVMEAVADHLAVCPPCAATLDSLHAADSVVLKLRLCLSSPAAPVDPDCERLAAAARLIPLEPTGAVMPMQDTRTLAPEGKPEAAPPRVFGGYALLHKLGHGGMGVVWKARHLRLNRLVALKMIRFGPASGRSDRERFRREGEAVARVRHAHVVEVYDAGECDGQPYFAMELLEGGDLAQRLRARRYAPREAAELVRTLARAVQVAHEAGVVHRDLKPANVLFTADGTPKVTDFGLAKMLDAETGHTGAGDVLGTPSYMAPEQARGDAAIGPRTDVYALGAILYELLAGKPPFRASTPRATLALVRDREPAPLSGLPSEDWPGLTAICARCLEKRPEERYPSAAALAEDIDRWLRGLPTEAKPSGTAARLWRFARRRAFLGAAIGACGLGAAAALAGWRFWKSDPRGADDPDAKVDDLERRLAGGEAVTLLDDEGRGEWSRWEVRVKAAETEQIAAGVRLSGVELALLALLRDPRTDRYRLRAEVRHERTADDGDCGIFFAHQAYPNSGEVVHAFVQVSFNDLISRAEQVADLNRKLFPADQQPIPAGNALSLVARSFGPRQGDHRGAAASRNFFKPLVNANPQFRSLAVEVAPEEVRVYWEGATEPVLQASPAKVQMAFQVAPGPPQQPNQALAFTPRGSLGLYVYGGVASFRSIHVEPLGPTN